MKLSRTVAYALHATLQLAAANSATPIPCSKLARDGAMPERFLLQVLRNLVSHGILESTRGVEGGYSLNRAPKAITLLEVIEAIEGPLEARMPHGDGLSRTTQARVRNALDAANEKLRVQLASVTLDQLIDPA